MKTLYLECNMGAAGDMLMAALYELLPDRAAFLAQMNALGLPGVEVKALQAKTCGISGTHISVTVAGTEEESADHPQAHEHAHEHAPEHAHGHLHMHAHSHEHGHDTDHAHHHHDHCHDHDHDHCHDHEAGHAHHHHHASPGHIGALIASLPLPEDVKNQAQAVYGSIALAEAKAHGCPVGDVHFHEVGALDAVADVVGVCLALSILNPEKIVASPVHVGSGEVRCAHGVVPVPAPATAALLEGVPCYGGEVRGELCTPTGAALLRHFAASFGPMPVLRLEKTGYGIGKKEFERANCVRAFWGEAEDGGNGEICELVCNLDDMTPEALSYAAARLLELGALDVYTVPGTMKKGRPGWELTVLCGADRERETAVNILRETTTNGVRARRCGKYFLVPRTGEADGVIYKAAGGFGVTHKKPEFEDAARRARESGAPIMEVLHL